MRDVFQEAAEKRKKKNSGRGARDAFAEDMQSTQQKQAQQAARKAAAERVKQQAARRPEDSQWGAQNAYASDIQEQSVEQLQQAVKVADKQLTDSYFTKNADAAYKKLQEEKSALQSAQKRDREKEQRRAAAMQTHEANKRYNYLAGLDLEKTRKEREELQAQASKLRLQRTEEHRRGRGGRGGSHNPGSQRGVNAQREAQQKIQRQVDQLDVDLRQAKDIQTQLKYNKILEDVVSVRLAEQAHPGTVKPAAYQRAESYLRVAKKGAKDPNNLYNYAKGNQWIEDSDINGSLYRRLRMMNEGEVFIYNVLLGSGRTKDAKEYLDSLTETLNARVGHSQAEQLKGIESDLGRQLAIGAYGIGAGLDQFASGTAQFFSSERRPTSATQFGSGEIREYLSDKGGQLPSVLGGGSTSQGVYDVITTTANMAPSILLSSVLAGAGAPAAAAQLAGSASMGIGAAGNAYNQALAEGHSKRQARMYSTIIGVSETTLQDMIGGFSALGGISPRIAGKIRNIENGFLRVTAELGSQAFAEGNEEYWQDILDPVFRNIIYGENNAVPLWTPEATYSFLLGALSAGTMEGANTVVRGRVYNNDGRAIKDAGLYDELLRRALETSSDTETHKLAEALKSGDTKATNFNVGELFEQYRQDGGDLAFTASVGEDAIDRAAYDYGRDVASGRVVSPETQAYLDAGLPLKVARQISSVVQKVRAGEELTADDVRALNLTQKRNRDVFNALTGLNLGDDVNRLISGKKDYKAVATLIGNRVAAIREAQAQQDAQEAEAAVEVAREAGRRAAEKPAAVDTQTKQTYNEGEPVVYVNGEAKTFDQFTEHVRAMDGGEAVTPQEMREMFDGIFEEQRRTLNERREAEQTRGADAAAPAELSGRADERSGGERGGVSGRTGNAEAESRRGQTGVHPGRGSTSGESGEEIRRAYLAAAEKEGTELNEASIQVRKDRDGRIIMREVKADTFAKTATHKALARKYEAVGAPLRGMLGNYKGMANGVSRLGKESFVRLDDPRYSGTQLGDHELGHQVFFLDRTRFDEAKTAVLSQLSAEDLVGLLKKYHLQFCKAYLTPAQITAYDEGWLPEHLQDQYEDKLIEEMLCDAYGSMDRGGAEMSKFHDAVAKVIDDAIGLDAEMQEALEPLNGDEVYSVKSMLNAAGFTVKPASEETGWLVQAFDADGNRVTTVTEEHIKHSGIGALIQSAVDHKTISKADAKEQREAAADLVNMMLKTQTPEMVWKFAGSALFSAVKSNSDGQYGTTIDFSTVCRKTQEMVTAMSEAMTRLGRGLTRDEIIDLQKDILEEGGTVNCPVCYVFSRWAGVGGILGNMKKFQDKYGHEWDDPAKLQSRIDELTRATATKKTLREVLLQNDVDYQEYAARKEALQAQKRENNAKLRQLKKGGKKAVAANAAAIEELQKSNRTIDAKINATNRSLKEIEDSGTPELAWLKRVRQAEDYWEHGYVKEDSILFDLNTADAFAEKYPLAWGYRTSRGPAAGKAILPYSDMRLGDLINGPKGSGAEFGESVEVGNGETQRVVRGGEFDKKQQDALKAAIQKMKAQNLIGGQRFQSTSDFRYDYGLDYLQAFWELQAIGGKMQTYTKIIEFVDLVAAIGGDVNMSVMPLEKGYKTIDGVDVLQYSNVTGIDPEAAIRANRMYDNAQLILVGINDRHIMAALEDSEATGGIYVGFVIPYHASGASINQFIRGLVENLGESFNESYYRDYSKVQNDSARKNATAEQKHRAELRELLLRGSYSVETGEVTETGKKKTKTVEWTPTEEDIAFLRGKSKDISGYTFEELRDIEKRALAGDKAAIAEYESWSAGVLWDVYQKMWVDESREDTYGVRLNSDQAEHIMPHEYWNKTVDRSKAYVNGFIFRSYCYSLGLTPRFTGIQSDGRRATAVVDGEKVNYGDFSDSTGYWKTLIDRPMYANDGKYRDQTPVNVTDISKEMLTPKYGEERWGEYKVREPSDQLAKRAADRFVERAQAGAEEEEKFSVSQEQTDSFVDWYRDFTDARKQRGRWSGHEVEEFFRDNPDYDFVQRFFDGDKSARKELQEMVRQIDDVAVLEGLSWYSTQSHWTPANEYRSAVTKVRNIYKKRIEELQAERVGGEEIKLEHRQYSVQEARSIFDQLNGNEDLTKLADKVFTVAEKLGVEIYATNKLLGGNMGNRAGASAGRYVWLKQNYFADKRYTNQQKAGTILHELIHSATVYAMDPSAGYSRYISSDPKLVDAVDQLRSIYRQVRADPDFKGEYGITNELEFVAELSNERFREKLAKKNLLQKVIDAIRTLFGIETDTALSGASAALDYLLDHADYTQAGYHNWDVALQAEREMSHRGKTLYMETPTQSAEQVEKENVRYSTSVNMGTFFSGGGLVDHALRSVTESVMAVELDDKAAAVFQMNNGDVTVDDVVKFVRDGKLDDLLKRQSIDYFHASPVCKNYSRMNIRRSTKSDSNVDMETAKATAEAIEKIRPKVFTLEQVPGYDGSAALKQITDTLDRLGYKWNGVVANAYDYGGATSRDRYLLRAVLDGELPAAPKKTKGVSWYAATADLIDGLPVREDGLTPFMQARIDNTPALAKAIREAKGPILILQGTAGRQVRWVAADKPCPSITTDMHDARVLLPDGTVKTADARFFARIMGLPDSYQLPQYRGKDNQKQAYKVIGNGVPVQLTQKFFGNLLHDTLDTGVRFSVAETLPENASAEEVEAAEDLTVMKENPDTFVDSEVGEAVRYSVDPDAQDSFQPLRDKDGNIVYVYKAFYAYNGRLYPPMVANLSNVSKKVTNAVSGTLRGLDTPVGVVLTADVGKLGRYKSDATEADRLYRKLRKSKTESTRKTFGEITKQIIEEGINPKSNAGKERMRQLAEERFPELRAADHTNLVERKGSLVRNTLGRLAVENAKGGGTLAYRPGWHSGAWPDAHQFYKNPDSDDPRMPNELVFAKCEISGAIDYQLDAMSLGMTENGGFDRTQAGLPSVPVNGYYKYRTNANPDEAPWYISGQLRIVEILDDAQCAEICAQYGVTPAKRENGKPIDLAAFGLKKGPVTPTADITPYAKNQAVIDNEAELRAALSDPQYEGAYTRREIDFDNPEVIKEFERNGQDAEYYRERGKDKSYLDDTGVRFSVTPEQDAEYLDAVKQGHMETAQRMVDEAAKAAGYTIKAYHGTGFEFTKFDKKKWGSNYNGYSEYGGGFYFTPDEASAKKWAEKSKGDTSKVMSVFLSAKRILGENDKVLGGAEYLQDVLDCDPATAEYNARTAYRFIDALQQAFHYTPAQVQGALEELGYDAIDARSNWNRKGQFIVFDPTQIKSADPVTYDDNGNVIPLSKRLDTEQRDIRFSISPEIQKWMELQKQFGTQPESAGSVRKTEVPKRTEKENKVSHTVATVMGANATPESRLDDIRKGVLDGDFSYLPKSNKATESRARLKLKRQGWADAYYNWSRDVDKGRANADLVAMGAELINNAANANAPTEELLEVMAKYTDLLRRSGQAVQAAKILQKMTPDGQLYQIQKYIGKLNEEAVKKLGLDLDSGEYEGIKLNEELVQRFRDAKTDKERDHILDLIAADVAKQMKTTNLDRFTAWRYLNMLGNFRTQIRNVLGNTGFQPVRMTKEVIAGIMEAGIELAGGKIERSTSALVDPSSFKAATDIFNEYRHMILSGGKYTDRVGIDFADRVEENRTIFGKTNWKLWNATLGKGLEAARKATNWAMDKGDEVFCKFTFADSIGRFMAAHHTTWDKASQELRDKAINKAVKDAAEATYRDNNKFSVWFSRAMRGKDTPALVRFIGEGVAAFRKTPANILVRAVEYSPLGIVTNINDLIKAKNGDVTGAEIVEHLAKTFTGFGLAYAGYALAAMGHLIGSAPDDDDKKKKALFNQSGKQQFAIVIGGKTYTIDWLAPEVIPLFLGATAADWAAENGLSVEGGLDAMMSMLDPILEMSMLQGISDALENVGQYGVQDALMAFIANALMNYASQFTSSTLTGQIKRGMNNRRMTTYVDKNSSIPPALQRSIGKWSTKAPVSSVNQIPYIDAWGDTQKNAETETGNWLQQLFSPGYPSTIKHNATLDEVERLHNATANNSVVLDTAPKYFEVNQKRKDLTAEEYVTYATARGQTAKTIMANLVTSSSYKALTDEQKAVAVTKAYDYANQLAKTKVSDFKVEDWVDAAQNLSRTSGIPVSTYVTAYAMTKDVGSVKDRNGDTIDNSAGLLKLQQLYKIPNLTKEQRTELARLFKVGKTVINYSEARTDRTLERMRRQAGQK